MNDAITRYNLVEINRYSISYRYSVNNTVRNTNYLTVIFIRQLRKHAKSVTVCKLI